MQDSDPIDKRRIICTFGLWNEYIDEKVVGQTSHSD